jgi:arabinose-5-phosphate isomerase
MLEKNPDISGKMAKDIMTLAPKTIEASQLVVKALDMMRMNNITQLPVVDKGNYVGVIHLHDILKEGIL